MHSLQENGFINYFGSQRFGVGENGEGSAHIGLAMLQQDYVSVYHCVDYITMMCAYVCLSVCVCCPLLDESCVTYSQAKRFK